MELIVIVACINLIAIAFGQSGRSTDAMNDICSRTPGTSLCRWYKNRSIVAQDPKIEARPDPAKFREPEMLSPPKSSSNVGIDEFEHRHPKPPMLPQPQQANEDQKVYCERYKTSYTYYCSQPDNGDKQFAVHLFCDSYKKACLVVLSPPEDSPQTANRASPTDEPQPGTTTKKPAYPPAQPKDVAKMCIDYKAVADAYCKGKEEGLTKSSCDQYRYYCANFKPPVEAPKPAVPPGATEYCGNYAKDYNKWCSGERPTPERFVTFCTGYNRICSALLAAPPKPVSTPNFGDNQNPLSPGFQGNKAENFGGANNPLVNPAASGADNTPPAPNPSSPAAAAAPKPAPEAVPAAAPPPPAANAPMPTWPGIGKGAAAFPQPPSDAPPQPFLPAAASSAGAPPQPVLGVGSSQSTGFGPGGFGSSSGTQAGPIGVSSGSGASLGGVPGLGSLGNLGSFGSSQGMGLGPGGIGSMSNTQAGPIGVSSGSGVGMGGGGNIPGLGALGSGGANPLGFLGRRKRSLLYFTRIL